MLRLWCAGTVFILSVSVQVLAQTKPAPKHQVQTYAYSHHVSRSFRAAAIHIGAQTIQNDQKQDKTTIPPPCVRTNGLEMTRQQIAASNMISDTTKRISVIMRAADMIWSWDADAARNAFKTAFALASDDYQSKLHDSSGDASSVVDLRYKVIAAISKRDLEWSRKLTDQILKEQLDAATSNRADRNKQDAATAERLLGVALSVLPSDKASAIAFANLSLRYPATTYVSAFLYGLSEVDRAAADQFYQRAVSAYAETPMAQFLFLSSYPFGNERDAGEMSNWIVYTVPSNFRGSRNLQQLFMTTLLRRSRLMIDNPSLIAAGARFNDSDQVLIALTRLKLQIDQFVPEFTGEAEEVKAAFSSTRNDALRAADNDRSRPSKSFSETVEQADRIANPGRREQVLAFAILRAKDEPLQQVLDATAKIDNAELRDNLLSWVYFERAQQLIAQDSEQAQKLAAKVGEVDLRAYLFSKIAEATIKQTKLDTKARELLEDVLDVAAKAPNTEPKARAFLGVAYLYSKIDANRSIAVLGEAVKTINKIESPDFSSDIMERKLKGQLFTSNAILRTPGFNPENAFREIGKIDFAGARNLAVGFSDKYLAAVMTLVLADQCLQIPDPKIQKKPGN